jgi:NADP-dependent 3-hydroxy acid dehydrogenase YdfG
MSKVVLITGASSGIGEATARTLAAAGHAVVLGARRAGRLEALTQELRAEGRIADHRQLDVTDLDSVRAFAAFAQERHGRIDVLVNNAGVMPLSPVAELRIDEWNQMIDVNLRGVLHGIAAVLPGMRERGAGQIVNVSSISGFAVFPTAAVYSATKFGVHALSEGLRQESADVRVTLVSPGVVATELTGRIADPELRAGADAMPSIEPSAIGAAIAFAIDQPADVDFNEIVVRPTVQPT